MRSSSVEAVVAVLFVFSLATFSTGVILCEDAFANKGRNFWTQGSLTKY